MVFAVATWTNNFSIESEKKIQYYSGSALHASLRLEEIFPLQHGNMAPTFFYRTSKSSGSPSFRTTIKEEKLKD
jgi:hypothetical protein